MKTREGYVVHQEAPESAPAAGPPRILIIHNVAASRPRSGRFRDVLARLDAAPCTVTIREMTGAGDALRLARAATPADFDLIAVAGGDGTLNDAINGVGPESPPLGVIPLGTANVLAHETGLGVDPPRIVSGLLSGHRQPVVPGVVNGRRFMMMAGVGFDAHVVGGVRRPVKRKLGKAAYMLEAARQLAINPCPHLDARIDGQPVAAATLVASRGRLYGGRFLLAPNADLRAPQLSVTLFPRRGRLAMAGYSAALPLGLLNRMNLVRNVTARRIEVTGPVGDPVQGDGDVIARLPATIGLAEHPVVLAVPPRASQPPPGVAGSPAGRWANPR